MLHFGMSSTTLMLRSLSKSFPLFSRVEANVIS